MTGTPDERTARALRAMLTERIDTLPPPRGVYETVRRRHRRRQVAAVAGVAVAAVVVPLGVVLRPEPAPVATEVCAAGPVVAPDPALPAQTGVRGSLGGDDALVRTVLAVGWQDLARAEVDGSRLDPATSRVRFVERAGPGVLALVTATDTAGSGSAGRWVAGPAGAPAVVGGTVLTAWSESPSVEPVLIGRPAACGSRWLVVSAPADAGVTVTPWPRVGADGRLVAGTPRDLPLAGGLAVVPFDEAGPRVTVSRGGRTIAGVQVDEADEVDAARGPGEAAIGAAVRDAQDPELAATVARSAVDLLLRTTAERVTGVRLLWSAPRGDGSVVMVALTLPSGATYVSAAVGVTGGYVGSYAGFMPAGRVDRAVLAWADDSGDRAYVRAPGAVRAEAVVTGGDRPAGSPDGPTVVPVPLAGGGGQVHVGAGSTIRRIRAYAADGSLLAEVMPGTGLRPLPTPLPR